MTARRPLLVPFVPLYRVGLAAAHGLHSLRTPRRLAAPVLSVGSVSAGGAGKTPFLAALVRLLQAAGYAPDVLSRGYGRRTRGTLRVDPAGDAVQYGDEPLLLARSLGVPVYVGASRYAAGLLAEQDLPTKGRVHLLDDGFSHRALHRTLDLALLTAEDTRDTLLPGGNLREPLAALTRADVLILRATEANDLLPLVRGFVGGTKPVWTIHRRLRMPAGVPEHPIVFSGIARPTEFESMIRRAGVGSAGTRRYRDHHTLSAAEVDALRRLAHASHADGYVTTGKDAARLTSAMLAELGRVGPVTVAELVVELDDPAAVLADIERALQPAG